MSTCNSEGAWEAGLGCGAESPVCSDGACSALSSLVIGYFHTCALLNDGSVRCWGRNQYGQVGTPILDGLVLQPTRVDGLPKVVSLTAGLYHTCALDELGQAWCWGADSHGQLGKGTQGDGIFPPTIFSSVPTVAKTTARLAQLCAGGTHTCALTAAGEVLCWGGSTSGATGLPSMGDPGQQGFPQAANSVPIQGATGLYCGEEFTCALGSTGLYCWGDNMFGELTDASLGLTHADPPHPIKASVDSGGKTYDIDFSMTLSLALGGGHGCALVFPFGFVCWGSGVLGQLADGGTSDAPTLVPADVFNYGVSLTSANYKSARVVAGGAVSCVLVPGDQVACVGADDSGQMGDGNTQPPEKTTTIVEPKGVTKGATFLATSGETSCAIHQGDVVCWGRNTSGETGIGSSSGFVAAPSRVVW